MGRKILVVDNSRVVLRLLTHHLEKEGYEVRTAEDGLLALSILEEFRPDVMFVDLVMPTISGDRLCRIVRKMPDLDNVYMVILSAIAAEEQIDFKSLGADACIAKGPATVMMEHVRTVLDHAARNGRSELSGQILGLDDVHEREIIKELLTNQKDFEITLQHMAAGFVELSPDAKIVYANANAVKLFQSSEERLISTNFADFFEADQQVTIASCFTTTGDATMELGEEPPIILNGKYVLLKIVPVIDREVKSYIVLIEDITERKAAQLELQKHHDRLEELVAERTSELEELNVSLGKEIAERKKIQEELELAAEQWSKTFNTISDLVSVHDKEMRLIKVNKSFADFIGKKPEELIGKYCYEVLHNLKKPFANCPHLRAIKESQSVSEEMHDPLIGKPLLITCSPYFDEEGNIVGTVHVARDISQQKQAEAEREKLIEELQSALDQVKKLSGFLPICASCKKIRDDKGYWNQIEKYIQTHSEAIFSHSICPECTRRLYPEIFKDDEDFDLEN